MSRSLVTSPAVPVPLLFPSSLGGVLGVADGSLSLHFCAGIGVLIAGVLFLGLCFMFGIETFFGLGKIRFVASFRFPCRHQSHTIPAYALALPDLRFVSWRPMLFSLWSHVLQLRKISEPNLGVHMGPVWVLCRRLPVAWHWRL